MLVADLTHFLDLPDGVPGPTRKLAEQLSGIVRAATAGAAGTAWTSALPCRRRPGNHACPGRMIVRRHEPSKVIHWQCSSCGDEGVISNWENSPHDLRRRTLTLAEPLTEIAVTDDIASTLQGLQFPATDLDSQRVVFAMRAHDQHILLAATDAELDTLTGLLTGEADRESNPQRRRRLTAVADALSDDTHATER
jgi:hypothetical protein